MVVLYISLYFTIYYTIETHIGTSRFWSYSSPIIKYPSKSSWSLENNLSPIISHVKTEPIKQRKRLDK